MIAEAHTPSTRDASLMTLTFVFIVGVVLATSPPAPCEQSFPNEVSNHYNEHVLHVTTSIGDDIPEHIEHRQTYVLGRLIGCGLLSFLLLAGNS